MRNRTILIVLLCLGIIVIGAGAWLLTRDTTPQAAETGGGPSVSSSETIDTPGAGDVAATVGDAASGSEVRSEDDNFVSVTTFRVAGTQPGRTTRLTGTVTPARSVPLVAKVGGTVVWNAGDVGTRVEADAPVVRLDDAELTLGLEQSEAQLKAAEANLARLDAGASAEELAQAESAVEQARAGLDRVSSALARQEELFAQGVIPEETLLSTRTEHEVARLQHETAVHQLTLVRRGATAEDRRAAEAQVEQARVAVRLAERQLADAVIRAPFSGLIAMQPTESGSLVGSGTPVSHLVDIDRVVIEAGVGEREINGLYVGQPVRLTVDALNDASVTGEIISLAPVADEQTRSFPVRIAADNPEHRLKPGMVARVHVEVGASREGVRVPSEAIVRRDDKAFVFVIQTGADGRSFVRETEVTLGAEAGTVRAGVTSGDTIAIPPPGANLHDGDFVRLSGEDI